jgi:protein required for attachment to host cells
MSGIPERSNFCVVVADASRARIFTLESDAGELDPTASELVEEPADLVQPERRRRPSEVFTESRPGLQRGGPREPQHAVSDHREQHKQEGDRRFADLVAEAAARVWRRYPTCRVILVASPKMMGRLRPAIARLNTGPTPYEVREATRDLTLQSPPLLRDSLAELGLLPARARLPPVRPSPMQESG